MTKKKRSRRGIKNIQIRVHLKQSTSGMIKIDKASCPLKNVKVRGNKILKP
jgi:hypothetical protein